MDGIDRARINQVIFEASKDSAYFANEQKRDALTDVKIAKVFRRITISNILS